MDAPGPDVMRTNHTPSATHLMETPRYYIDELIYRLVAGVRYSYTLLPYVLLYIFVNHIAWD